MWILVLSDLWMLRKYLLQIFGFVALAIIVFIRPAPHFIATYFTVFPVVTAMTLPQISFTQEERSQTFVFLRSLPLSPRHIVAAKYIVAMFINILFWAAILAAQAFLPVLQLTYVHAGLIMLIACFLSSISYLQHFILGLKSAKTALLLTFFGLSALGMFIGQTPVVKAWLQSSAAEQLFVSANNFAGSLIGALVGAVLLFISYQLSVLVFTRQDISKLP